MGVCASLKAQTPKDIVLDSVGIVYKRTTTPVTGNVQKLLWDTKTMKIMPKILGNTNPIHLAQSLPGIQTNSEFDAGIHIQGCETGHNEISIEGIPVYNPSHLLGFFSIFNTSHFSGILIEKSPSITSTNHLGGSIEMVLSKKEVLRTNGELSVGPMSSQGTIRLPLNKKVSLTLSARGSYLNLLYGSWLKVDDDELNYRFGDYNLTLLYHPTATDKIWINGYYGLDKAQVTNDNANNKFYSKWSNYLGSLHWKHLFPHSSLTQTFYTTNYINNVEFLPNGEKNRLHASIYDYGYQAILENALGMVGAKSVFHRILPQTPELSERKTNTPSATYEKQNCQEYNLFGEIRPVLSEKWNATGGLKSTLFIDPDKQAHLGLSPMMALRFTPTKTHSLELKYQWLQQYLFQTGCSNLGLPTEFWLPVSKQFKPQKAHNLTLSYDICLADGDWKISTSLYYKKLTHQIEYIGNILELLETDYQLENNTACGEGNNFGFNIMVNKCTGKWSGWMSYSYGRAFRTFDHPTLTKRYPSNHERIHEFNLLTVYRPSKKWDLSATFVCASGNPFTAPDYIYWYNGHIITHFGEHNANRLNPYLRLDLSANYTFKKTKNKEHGINLTLYNATYAKNDIFLRLKFRNHRFAYRPLRFFMPLLPSINYYYKF